MPIVNWIPSHAGPLRRPPNIVAPHYPGPGSSVDEVSGERGVLLKSVHKKSQNARKTARANVQMFIGYPRLAANQYAAGGANYKRFFGV